MVNRRVAGGRDVAAALRGRCKSTVRRTASVSTPSCRGTIHTPFVDRYLRDSYEDPEEGLRAIRARQLTGELGTPEDVAHAILFLASDESRFVVVGSGLAVDGGLSSTRG